MDTVTKTPNPDRVYAVIAGILERRYGVKIEYTLVNATEANHDSYLNFTMRIGNAWKTSLLAWTSCRPTATAALPTFCR